MSFLSDFFENFFDGLINFITNIGSLLFFGVLPVAIFFYFLVKIFDWFQEDPKYRWVPWFMHDWYHNFLREQKRKDEEKRQKWELERIESLKTDEREARRFINRYDVDKDKKRTPEEENAFQKKLKWSIDRLNDCEHERKRQEAAFREKIEEEKRLAEAIEHAKELIKAHKAVEEKLKNKKKD